MIFLTSYIQHVVCLYNCMLIFSVIKRIYGFHVNLRNMSGALTQVLVRVTRAISVFTCGTPIRFNIS